MHNEKYLKAKIKFYEGKINKYFHNNRMPKEGSHCISILVILINSVFKIDKKNYYLQVVLSECKK